MDKNKNTFIDTFNKVTRNKFHYFYRDEIDTRVRLINTMILNVIGILVLFLIAKICVGRSIVDAWVQIVILILSLLTLVLVNIFPKSYVPISVSVYIVNLVVFPIQFYLEGGGRSGMLIWMFLGNLTLWVCTRGAAKAIGVILDYIVVIGCLYMEYFNGTNMQQYEQPMNNLVNVALAFVISTLAMGILEMTVVELYERQADIMAQKDKDILDANSNLEVINISLEQASNAKSNFLANMSHEIRTPINAILGLNEMILRESREENVVGYANDIDSAGHHLLALVNDILDYSKLESGKLEIHPTEYDLFSVMNDCYNIILMKAKRKELKIIVENDYNLPSILFGDEIRVRQIIMNLLDNAVKYTKDGYVKISYGFENIDAENIEFIIKVKDTGIGMSRLQQERLFEAREELDELNHRTLEGIGVGLAITKRLVSLMEGRISVESQEGVGSEFTVSLPQRIAGHGEIIGDFAEKFRHSEVLQNIGSSNTESIKAKAIVSNVENPVLDGEKVTGSHKLKSPDKKKKEAPFHAPDARLLIVDDVKMNLNVVRLLLKNTDIQMDLAESGQEALKYTLLKHYDLILMDHMMPEMDGIETMHKIKEQNMGLNQNTPVVVLTANAIQNVEEMYRQEGFTDYLSKPVKSEKLEQAMFKYLPKEKVLFEDLLAGLTPK